MALSACGAGNNETAAPEKAMLVNVENASKAAITNELTYPGQVKGSEQIAVMSKLSGKVDGVMANTGDYVKAGDILFTMDETDLANNIKSLEAQIATADAAVKSAQTSVSLASGSSMKSQILQAEGGVEQAQLALEQREMALNQAQNAYDNAVKNFNDITILFNAGTASRAQFDQADTALTNAKIALDQARASYDMAAASLDQALQSHTIVSKEALPESIRRAQDALDQATAQKNSLVVSLDAAKEKLNDASVRSPIDGVVSSRNVEPQTMLSAATVPFTVVSSDTVEIKVNVTEVIVNKIEPGQKVPVKISAASGEDFTGEILTISPAANEITSAFEVRIKVDNKSGIIKPGMYAEASFTKENSSGVIVLPRSAVVVENGVQVVYTAENGRAKRNEVTTGVDNGQEIEITGGINEGDSVIIKGQNYVKDGSLISIEESGGDAS